MALLYHGIGKAIQEDGNTQIDKAQYYFKLAKSYQIEANRQFEHIFMGKRHLNLASSYNTTAVIKYSLGNYESAIRYYRKAENIRIALYEEVSHNDLSITYKGICDSYEKMAGCSDNDVTKLRCYKIALISLKKAISIRIEKIRNGNQKLQIDHLEKKKIELEKHTEELKRNMILVESSTDFRKI